MLKKRIAMGILAGLLACSFIAGCGGGDKGTSEPPKPKPIAADLKDIPLQKSRYFPHRALGYEH